ncbi:hypothetical protein T484DRAFT_1773862, partial [Baffinella frigidus]
GSCLVTTLPTPRTLNPRPHRWVASQLGLEGARGSWLATPSDAPDADGDAKGRRLAYVRSEAGDGEWGEVRTNPC